MKSVELKLAAKDVFISLSPFPVNADQSNHFDNSQTTLAISKDSSPSTGHELD